MQTTNKHDDYQTINEINRFWILYQENQNKVHNDPEQITTSQPTNSQPLLKSIHTIDHRIQVVPLIINKARYQSPINKQMSDLIKVKKILYLTIVYLLWTFINLCLTLILSDAIIHNRFIPTIISALVVVTTILGKWILIPICFQNRFIKIVFYQQQANLMWKKYLRYYQIPFINQWFWLYFVVKFSYDKSKY